MYVCACVNVRVHVCGAKADGFSSLLQRSSPGCWPGPDLVAISGHLSAARTAGVLCRDVCVPCASLRWLQASPCCECSVDYPGWKPVEARWGWGWGWDEVDAPIGRAPEAPLGKSNVLWDKFPLQLLRGTLGWRP